MTQSHCIGLTGYIGPLTLVHSSVSQSVSPIIRYPTVHWYSPLVPLQSIIKGRLHQQNLIPYLVKRHLYLIVT